MTCLLPESTEIDSEGGSSSEERGGNESRRRSSLLSLDPNDSLPKKRRKQSTPVKFSTSLTTTEESEEEYNNHHQHPQEGKPTSPKSSKDENLNNEFRCQFCSQFFDNRGSLELHLECEHQAPDTSSSVSPINLSGISIRNFASNWQNNEALKIRNNNHHPQFPPTGMPPGFPPGPPLAQFLPFPMPDPSQLQRAAMGQFPKIFNPDAYCDLCNKEFCNKYFLKTHKANKHGIYTDPPMSQGSDAPSANPFITASSPIGNFPNNLGIKVTEQTQRIDNNGIQSQLQQAQLTVPCDLCPKRFKNEDSLRKHRYKTHLNPNNESADSTQTQTSLPISSNEEGRQSPGGMEALFKQEYNVEQEESSYPATPNSRPISMSPQSTQQVKETVVNGDRLRRLGVMNPEAFCELCCKEYHNKHFLRQHKLKRHGIFIPDSSETSPSTPGSASSWHQVQTSPLNLIMADGLGNGSDSGDRTEEYACRFCGIRFQTQSLYQLHLEKIHDSSEHSSPRPDQEIDSTEQRGDAISEDLQKLQTMILQLNGLESNKAASCALCGKDYDTPGALKNHMVAEHGVVPENLSPFHQQPAKSPPTAIVTSAYCTICEREYPNQEMLKKHIAEDHQPSTPTCSTPQLSSSVPTTPKSSSSQQLERKPSVNVTPTSSYCEICNKELCNKYFMKTHMQKMHGIEIENGAQIGGVVCNICKKELCSKYFLRVHKQNTHGIIEEGATPATNKQESFEPPAVEDTALKPEHLGDLNLRYITHFTEICPICNRRFRSPKWLKVHLQSEHGKAGIDKYREIEQSMPKTPARVPNVPKSSQQQQQQQQPLAPLRIPNGFEPSPQIRAELAAMGNQVLSNFFGGNSDDQPVQTYRCSQPNCNFSTSILPLYFLHERSHNQPENITMDQNERMLQCPICAQAFAQPDMLRQHIVTRHPTPFPGLLSQFPVPLLTDFTMANDHHQTQERNEFSDSKEVLRQPSPQQIMNEIDTNKMKKLEENTVQVMAQGAYKCAQCGFATANLNRIKKHVKKDHKSLGDATETALAELSKTLKDVANKHKVPASYAMPQDANLTPDKTIMQPFIIEELLDNPPSQNGCEGDDQQPSLRRFAPALVFLPVKTRLSSALTLSFTLNPA